MFDGFLENIGKWNVIVGLIIVVLALVCMIVAKPLATKLCGEEKKDKIPDYMMAFKIAALILAVIGCVLVIFINN